MKRVLILVEGQTEERFANGILSPYFASKRVVLKPVLIFTRKLSTGKRSKGGTIRYAEFKKQIQRLLGDSSAVCVSTLIDYYGLPEDFPGRSNASGITTQDKALSVENAICKDIDTLKFKPHLSVHEHEALLFSKPQILADKLSVPLAKIENIPRYATPEEINDSPTTSPSRRLKEIYPGYTKVVFGYEIAMAIGLDAMRGKCPHFNDWVTMLENI